MNRQHSWRPPREQRRRQEGEASAKMMMMNRRHSWRPPREQHGRRQGEEGRNRRRDDDTSPMVMMMTAPARGEEDDEEDSSEEESGQHYPPGRRPPDYGGSCIRPSRRRPYCDPRGGDPRCGGGGHSNEQRLHRHHHHPPPPGAQDIYYGVGNEERGGGGGESSFGVGVVSEESFDSYCRRMPAIGESSYRGRNDITWRPSPPPVNRAQSPLPGGQIIDRSGRAAAELCHGYQSPRGRGPLRPNDHFRTSPPPLTISSSTEDDSSVAYSPRRGVGERPVPRGLRFAETSSTVPGKFKMMHDDYDEYYSSSSSPDEELPMKRTVVEIVPGLKMLLRGSKETWEAFEQRKFYAATTCVSCSTKVFCIKDADYVLCPVCRVVSPLEISNHPSRWSRIGGLGLGFTLNSG